MQLFVAPLAPNALRVMMLIREKRLDIPEVTVDFSSPEKKAAYRAINPLGQVPALQTEAGEIISESLVICEYLDAISGAPRLCGESLDERTRIAMWERRAEMNIFVPAVEYGHNTHPMMKNLFRQFPDWAQTQRDKILASEPVIAMQLARHDFLAGDKFTLADITAYIGYRAAEFFGIAVPENAAIKAWLQRIDSRDCAKGLFAAS